MITARDLKNVSDHLSSQLGYEDDFVQTVLDFLISVSSKIHIDYYFGEPILFNEELHKEVLWYQVYEMLHSLKK